MKLATFRTEGGERIGVVHAGDTKLFDLAAAAGRTGTANPAFASMLSLIDAGEGGLDAARALVERYGNDESLSRDAPAPSFSRRCRSRGRCATACRSRCTSCRRRAAS